MDYNENNAEKTIRELSENKNPYSPECPNRHLWSEGFRAGYEFAKQPKFEVPERKLTQSQKEFADMVIKSARDFGTKTVRY